jgi:hypothetical protein
MLILQCRGEFQSQHEEERKTGKIESASKTVKIRQHEREISNKLQCNDDS